MKHTLTNSFNSWTIKELSTWIKHFDNYTILNELLFNKSFEGEVREAKKILKYKKKRIRK